MPRRAAAKKTEEGAEESVAGPQVVRGGAPPSRRGRGAVAFDWEGFLADFIDGEWVQIVYASASTASSNANKIRSGKVDVPNGPGYWEVTTRKNDDGTSSLWVRYLGNDDEE